MMGPGRLPVASQVDANYAEVGGELWRYEMPYVVGLWKAMEKEERWASPALDSMYGHLGLR